MQCCSNLNYNRKFEGKKNTKTTLLCSGISNFCFQYFLLNVLCVHFLLLLLSSFNDRTSHSWTKNEPAKWISRRAHCIVHRELFLPSWHHIYCFFCQNFSLWTLYNLQTGVHTKPMRFSPIQVHRRIRRRRSETAIATATATIVNNKNNACVQRKLLLEFNYWSGTVYFSTAEYSIREGGSERKSSATLKF